MVSDSGVEYEGLDIRTSENVYGPSDDSYLAADFIAKEVRKRRDKGLEVLDMGTGSGIIGITVGKEKNVGSITFSDINTYALELAEKNLDRNKEKISAKSRFVLSDMFARLDDNFDVIIFNPPYLRSEPSGKDGKEWWDGGTDGVEVAMRFLDEAIKHLKHNGSIFLVHSSLSDIGKLKIHIEDLGLKELSSMSSHFFFETITCIRLERNAHGL